MSEVPFERRRSVGRYTILGAIASGGMASVHLGRLQGTGGFARTVAIKRLHPGLAKDSQLVTMLLDEARTSARVQHPNVVSTLDVVEDGGEVLLVLEYVHGESLANLLGVAAREDDKPPVEVVAAIVAGALRGLHAAHEAKDERGLPLGLVHRDVSPQNILVDTNGNARLLDFGVAKACGRQQISQVGILKGKVAYMAPEQVHGSVSRRSDVFSMGIVLWESLTGERLFQGKSDGEILAAVMMAKVPPVRSKVPSIPQALDDVVLRSVRRLPDDRFATALDFALALEASVSVASPARVAEWLQELAGETLAKREQLLLAEESAAAPPVAVAPQWLRPRTLLAAGAALALLGLG
ncbi:MAG TPA: serine/threonine-protein kinase, partial [Labilithrix sp.]|nr:serine/threonine-protein kinase [Labilithrix sp.]